MNNPEGVLWLKSLWVCNLSGQSDIGGRSFADEFGD